MPLFCCAVTMRKRIPGGERRTMLLGYRVTNNEDEARGNFVVCVQKDKPDFELSDVLVLEVNERDLRRAMERTEGGTTE